MKIIWNIYWEAFALAKLSLDIKVIVIYLSSLAMVIFCT